MKVGSLGLLYCNEAHSFTTPFLVYSEPDLEKSVSDIWPERWRLPFRIFPFGNPTRQVHMGEAKANWSILKSSPASSVTAAMNITGTTVFVPVDVSADDWASIVAQLACNP
jgi:hypothetical protein